MAEEHQDVDLEECKPYLEQLTRFSSAKQEQSKSYDQALLRSRKLKREAPRGHRTRALLGQPFGKDHELLATSRLVRVVAQ